jgi:ammonia channel protein AmtB
MFGFLQKLMVCAAAGTLLSLIFLTPAGGMVGAMSGLLIGICVAMGEWKVQREEMVVAPIGSIRLIGSY